MKINVLMIPTGGMGVDGITNVIMNYGTYLDKEKYGVYIVSPKAKCDSMLYRQLKNNFESNRCTVIDMFCRNKPIAYIYNLIKIIKRNEIDIVHVHGSSSLMFIELLAAWIAGVKVRIAHSHNTSCSHMTMHRVFKPIFNVLCNRRIACGELAGKWLFENRLFKVLNNGIDAVKFAYSEAIRTEVRNSLGLNKNKVLGHVGSFNRQKNHSYMLDVFAELLKTDDSWRLVLIGDGELRGEVEQKAEKLNIRDKVLFLGRCLEAQRYIQAFDCMILPSIYEGLPLVALEWQAAGLPLIVSDSVTSEIKLTDLVEFISLNKSAKEWVESILCTDIINRRKNDYVSVLRQRGYDIRENINALEEIYIF